MTETYLTLAKIIKGKNTEITKEIKEVFKSLIELRDPTIDNFLKTNKNARNLLEECAINIPSTRDFQPILEAFENLWATPLSDEKSLVNKGKIVVLCKDLKPFLEHPKTYSESIDWENFLKMAVEVLCRSAEISWDAFKQSKFKEQHKSILNSVVDIWEVLVRKGKFKVLLEVKNGDLLYWMLTKITQVLSEPNKEESELLHIGIQMQKVFVLLLKANDLLVNEALESLKFGQIFGQHLQLQYEALKKYINHQVYINYPIQNNIRLHLFKYLLYSSSEKLKSQFLKSRFIERMVADYVKNLQQFKTKFDQIDLKFLAFKNCYPLRNEAIEFIREILENKEAALVLYTEIVQRINMHLLVFHECQILEAYETKSDYFIQTSLLLLTIITKEIPEIGENDERVRTVIREVLQRRPILKRQFSELANRFK